MASALAEALYKMALARSNRPPQTWIKEDEPIPQGAKIIRKEECWGHDGRCHCPELPCRWTVVELAH